MSTAGNVAIRVDGLGKKFQLGQIQSYKTLRDSLVHAVGSRIQGAKRFWSGERRGPARRANELWALKDVSFEIKQGEAVGIVGGNGAGKSTLLKILARITNPTEGEGTVTGRVGSLLEVGTGFHPELTGRENIYLNGAILGMPWTDIRKRFDDIVAFAEVERFIDTPVKHYSSGMYMRLAFSVSAHLEPDIMLVDEVLAVGDVAFQKKCIGRMNSEAETGRTILFVSHNLSQIQAFCNRAIWIDKSHIREDGRADEVIRHYLASAGANTQCERSYPEDAAPGDEHFHLLHVAVAGADGAPRGVYDTDEEIQVVCDCRVLDPLHNAQVVIEINTQEGIIAFCSASYDCYPRDRPMEFRPGRYRYRCKLPPYLLNRGQYTVSVWGMLRQGYYPIEQERAVQFEVSQLVTGDVASHHRRGIFRPQLSWDIEPDPRVAGGPGG